MCLLIMEFRFNAVLCSNVGEQNFDACILDVHVGCIWLADRRFNTRVL